MDDKKGALLKAIAIMYPKKGLTEIDLLKIRDIMIEQYNHTQVVEKRIAEVSAMAYGLANALNTVTKVVCARIGDSGDMETNDIIANAIKMHDDIYLPLKNKYPVQ
jgi:hypothetical protein